MANLILTHRCTLKCDYCFALDFVRQATTGGSEVSFDVFEAYIDFLDRSGLQEARLLGGEPTLHQEFARLVRYAHLRGKKVTVFSNGLMPKPALQVLMEIPPEQCTVLINLAAGESLPQARRRQINVMRQLAQRACPGYTISQVTTSNLTSMLDTIDESGCRRSLRIALAQPADSQNKYIHPKQYHMLASRIVTLATEAQRRAIHLEFDCGFVRCMFSEEDLQNLRESNVSTDWHCSPVVDIDIDGTVFPCFALSGRLRIQNGFMRSAESLRKDFDYLVAVLRVAGIFPECSTCELRVAERCSGGCLAAALRRMQKMPIAFSMQAEDAKAFLQT
ncbi:MAG TPA: radical SAM protein [Anaerolineales bacterium]|nr:radical SAM protein [Anaerolineales bacterium]